MDTLEELKRNFRGRKVPAMLADLAEYIHRNSNAFAGSFELEADRFDNVKAWFKEKEAGFSKIIAFGLDGIGSMYGLWLYNDTPVEDAPVVYLSSEGEGNTVLADDLQDFFRILATNRDWECFENEFTDEFEECKEENTKFKKWIKQKYDLDPADDPLAIVEKARKNNPDFQEWIDGIMNG